MPSDQSHPSNDDLELFLLHQMQGDELDAVETHILACESCVNQLEEMELNLAATRLALSELHQQTVAANVAAAQKEKTSWLHWFSVRNLSLAGAALALALTVTVVPRHTPVTAELSALRGVETTTLPVGRPLLVHIDAKDLKEGAVSIQVVSAEGKQVWTSDSKVQGQVVSANLPPIDLKGDYLLKVFAAKSGPENGELLREVAFDVR